MKLAGPAFTVVGMREPLCLPFIGCIEDAANVGGHFAPPSGAEARRPGHSAADEAGSVATVLSQRPPDELLTGRHGGVTDDELDY